MRLRAVGGVVLALVFMPVGMAAGSVPHAAVADFDGDGVSDLSVLRPDGRWFIRPSGLGCCWSFSWGYTIRPDARAVPGDYDGNRSTDPAMFSPTEGTWQIMPSNGTGAYIVPFGQSGDVPVPADYDGNGSTDPAVYRPANGHWYILHQPDVTEVAFGQSGDVPVPGDYDGDGRADVAVFRASIGSWIVLRSTDGGETSDSFGLATDTLVPADYDGDGRTDLAVYRDAESAWWIRRSGDGAVEVQTWGKPGDLVAPGDYDGDGRTDIAVYEPSTGRWLIMGRVAEAELGTAEDVPVAGAYLPGATPSRARAASAVSAGWHSAFRKFGHQVG